MRFRIFHRTRYRYPVPVGFGEQRLLLRPWTGPDAVLEHYTLTCEPAARMRWLRDCFENVIALAAFEEGKWHELSISVAFVLRTEARNPFAFLLETDAMHWPPLYHEPEAEQLAPCRALYPDMDTASAWCREALPEPPAETVAHLVALTRLLHDRLEYRAREDEGIQTPAETIAQGGGSCRDLSVLLIALLRAHGYAARFVSGYLYEGDKAAPAHRHLRRAEGAMHAWCEVYLPGAGWRGLDPTNGVLANENFIPTAAASRPEWTTPVSGLYLNREPVDHELEVDLQVVRTETD